MKKYLKTLFFAAICLVMVFSLAACGEKETASDGDAAADVMTDPVVSFGENLPSWQLSGDYVKGEITEDLAEKGIFDLYVPANDEDNVILALYHVDKDGHTIQDCIKNDIETYVPKGEPVKGGEYDEWEEPGDYHFGYYVFYDSKSYDKPCYIMDYIFEDGDQFVYAEYIIPVQTVEIGEDGAFINLPYDMVETEISAEAADAGCVGSYKDPNGDNANVETYIWDTDAATGEELLAGALEECEGKCEVVDSGTYDFVGVDGNTYEGCYIEFMASYDGVKYHEISSVYLVNGKAVCCNVNVPAEGYDYAWESHGALIWSIDANVKQLEFFETISFPLREKGLYARMIKIEKGTVALCDGPFEFSIIKPSLQQ